VVVEAVVAGIGSMTWTWTWAWFRLPLTFSWHAIMARRPESKRPSHSSAMYNADQTGVPLCTMLHCVAR